MEGIISESLGRNLAVELDPKTGKVTIVGSNVGVELPAVAVLALMDFLMSHDLVWTRAAFGRIDEKSEEDAA